MSEECAVFLSFDVVFDLCGSAGICIFGEKDVSTGVFDLGDFVVCSSDDG